MDESHFDPDNRGQSWIDRKIAAIATKQHGVISREQLGKFLSGKQIDRRVTARRYIPLWPATYAVGQAQGGPRGRRMPATLACGENSFISHRTAGSEWRVIDNAAGLIDVTVDRRNKPKLKGIRPHLSALPEDEVGHMGCLPITSLA